MNFERVASMLEGIPHIQPRRGRLLYDFVLANRPAQCLELGFAHGVSSCYIAAALEEVGSGHLTTVDLRARADRRPNIEDLLERTRLEPWVTFVREYTSYTWFLKREIEQRSPSGTCDPFYNFCFIDGAKNWTIDGMAFFLVDKLLKPGGWILFDDYDWTYGGQNRTATDGINHHEMGPDELSIPHIKLIVDLLIAQHPDYSEIRIQDDVWAWAHKVRGEKKRIVIENSYTFKALFLRVLQSTLRKLRLGELVGVSSVVHPWELSPPSMRLEGDSSAVDIRLA